MIIISATLDFETEADRDKAVSLTKDIQMATRTEEEGCISYCFAADPAVANRIQVYELWKDEESRNKMIKLADLRRQNISSEIERLSSMEEIKSRILGISEEEILNG